MSATWYTVDQAYREKFGDPEAGPAISTFKANMALQPKGGVPDGWQQGKKAWRWETVERWLPVDDSTLGEYLASCAPGVKIPRFIIAGIERREARP